MLLRFRIWDMQTDYAATQSRKRNKQQQVNFKSEGRSGANGT